MHLQELDKERRAEWQCKVPPSVQQLTTGSLLRVTVKGNAVAYYAVLQGATIWAGKGLVLKLTTLDTRELKHALISNVDIAVVVGAPLLERCWLGDLYTRCQGRADIRLAKSTHSLLLCCN